MYDQSNQRELVIRKSHTKNYKIARTGAKLQAFLRGRGLKKIFGPPIFAAFSPSNCSNSKTVTFHNFFSQNPKIHMSYLAEKINVKTYFWIFIFLHEFVSLYKTNGNQWINKTHLHFTDKWSEAEENCILNANVY